MWELPIVYERFKYYSRESKVNFKENQRKRCKESIMHCDKKRNEEECKEGIMHSDKKRSDL